MSHISQEEENYLRLNLLLSGICSRAVRSLFDKKFPPPVLYTTIRNEKVELTKLKEKGIINTLQYSLLFPSNGYPDSKTFDLNLMITMLINQASDTDSMLSQADITQMNDLENIKKNRNKILHDRNVTLDCQSFDKIWDEIRRAVGRLGGQEYLAECTDLKTKALEPSTVPWKERVNIIKTMEDWREDMINFVETRGAQNVLKCVQGNINNCVTITASFGVGKTSILRYVALQMETIGYDIIPVTNPEDITRFYNPNHKTMFVIDDICGKYSLKQSEFDCWKPCMESINEVIRHDFTKIIVACRLQVFLDRKFQSLSIFSTSICNLLSKDFSLMQSEKQSISDLYLNSEETDCIHLSFFFYCFPLLCKSYKDKDEGFLRNAYFVYAEEIDKLKTERHFGKYCVLALCVVFNNNLLEKWFTEDIQPSKRQIIENTCDACGLARDTSRLVLLDELNSFEHTFIKKANGIYSTVHDVLFDFLVSYFENK